MDTNSSFSGIRERRKALGLSLKELSQQVGCAVVTLKKIESGERKPSRLMAERLAQCLKINVKEQSAFIAHIRQVKAEISIPHTELHTHRTPFIGRQTELEQLKILLTDPMVRLITIVGPGGIGKTRLAQAVLGYFLENDPAHFIDGIFFIDLSSLTSADYLIASLASSLKLELDTSSKDPRPDIQQLSDFLSTKKTLVILDNFEHILDGAEKLDYLQHATPQLRILVTSRERLGLGDEFLFPLEGLSYPENSENIPMQLQGFSAIELFLAHTRRIQPTFNLTEQNQQALVRICSLTEGNSLALELAAAWMDTLALKDIADELEAGLSILQERSIESTGRHASMQKVFSTSLNHLGVNERRIFNQLCMFQGGFTRPAAKVVAEIDFPTLALFTQKSLIRLNHVTGKYHIHELLRQFGCENLKESGEYELIGQAHFDYYLGFLTSAENKLHGPEQTSWLEKLDLEQDNLRFGLQWGIDHPENSDGLVDMVCALSWFWRMRSHVAEACAWLEKIRRGSTPSLLRQARLHWVSGHHEWMRGAFPESRLHQEVSLGLLDTLGMGKSLDMGKVKISLGMTAALEGKASEARFHCEEALEIFKALSDDWFIAFTLGWLALPQQTLGARQLARESVSESIRIFRALGDRWAMGLNINHFAEMEWDNGHFESANELAKEALDLEKTTNHRHSVGQTLILLGKIAQEQENYSQARDFYMQSLDIFTQMGHLVYVQQAKKLLKDLPT